VTRVGWRKEGEEEEEEEEEEEKKKEEECERVEESGRWKTKIK
jgi:hypothetical protein